MTLALSKLDLERPYKVSKLLKVQVLLEELGVLFDALEPFYIVNVARVSENSIIERAEFEKAYLTYIERLKKGETITPNPLFSSVLTRDLNALWSLSLGEGKQMAKLRSPAIQIQNHRLAFGESYKILPMAYGLNTLSWGLQFSFPQIWLGPTGVCQVLKEPLANVGLYRDLMNWIKESTKPTPFLFGEKRVNSPIRLDRRSFSWINDCPSLKEVRIAH